MKCQDGGAPLRHVFLAPKFQHSFLIASKAGIQGHTREAGPHGSEESQKPLLLVFIVISTASSSTRTAVPTELRWTVLVNHTTPHGTFQLLSVHCYYRRTGFSSNIKWRDRTDALPDELS